MVARATPASELVRRAGVVHRVHGYAPADRHGRARDDRPDYGLEAAAALDVPPGRVLKTLVVVIDGTRLAAGVVPVDRQLDPRRLAATLGGRRAELAEPDAAERVTRSVVGGISPLVPRGRLPVVVDRSALSQPTVFVSAGRRGLQLELAPADLVALAHATVADISRSGVGSRA